MGSKLGLLGGKNCIVFENREREEHLLLREREKEIEKGSDRRMENIT
jgi:hypothetical protein